MRYRLNRFLFVVIFGLGCASLCSAQDVLRVSESAIRIHFQSDTTTADLPLRNTARQKVTAHIALELVDPHGTIRAQADRTVVLSPGVTSAHLILPAIPAAEKDQSKGHLFLYRLRYTVLPDYFGGGGFPPIEGIVSVSEVAPQLFELHAANAAGVPILGICLGLQAMFASSEEAPGESGLGFLPQEIHALPANVKSPHIGWNQVRITREGSLLKGIPPDAYFYFAHSYAAPATAESTVAACDHGFPFAAVIESNNLRAVQFHPEKSGEAGAQVLRNFLESIE